MAANDKKKPMPTLPWQTPPTSNFDPSKVPVTGATGSLPPEANLGSGALTRHLNLVQSYREQNPGKIDVPTDLNAWDREQQAKQPSTLPTQSATVAPIDASADKVKQADAQAVQAQDEAQQKQQAAAADTANPPTPASADVTASKIVQDQLPKAPVPPPINPSDAKNAQVKNLGDQTFKDVNLHQGPWWTSNAMSNGLISFGLNLLSGNDLATSFNQAGKAFNNVYGRDQRTAYADELLQKGYDRQEVMEWIDKGDSSILTDPAQKALKEQQLQKAQYENSDAYRQYQRDQDKFENDLKVANLQDQREGREETRRYHATQLQIQQDKLKAKADAAKLAAGNVGSRDVRMAEQGSLDYQTAKPMVQRARYFEHGVKTLEQMNLARQKNDAQGERIAYNQALMDVTRGEMGGQASMDADHMRALGLDPSWFTTGPGGISLKAGVITDAMRNALNKAIQSGHAASRSQINDVKRSRYQTLAAQYGPERARAITNMYWPGDPIPAEEDEEEQPTVVSIQSE